VYFAVFLMIGVARGIADAERLPISQYTIADGLPSDRVYCLRRDSRGFLWFCTADGLSRFDGRDFKTYGRGDGLPHPLINDLLETRAGVYWAATNGGGVAYLDPSGSDRGRHRFVPVALGNTQNAQRVNALLGDSLGHIWAATDDGVFVSRGDAGRAVFERVDLGFVPGGRTVQVWDIVEDRAGTIWIATSAGLSRRSRDGRLTHHPAHPTRAGGAVWALEIDDAGRIWAGLDDGVVVFHPPSVASTEGSHPWDTFVRQTIPDAAVAPHHRKEYYGRITSGVTGVRGVASWYTFPRSRDGDWIRALHRATDGRIWVGLSSGRVYSFDRDGFRPYTTNHRLTADKVLALGDDIDGNVWLGTYASGAMKLARDGFVAYGRGDGLSGGVVRSISGGTDGLVHVVTDDLRVHRFDGGTFTAVRPNVPDPIEAGRLWHTALQDRQGGWWITTGEGLYRFPRVSRFEELGAAKAVARYTVVNGLPIHDVRRAFEDSRGDLWLRSRAETTLVRWDHVTGTFHGFSESDGLRAALTVNAVAEDRGGQIWIGFREGGVARLRNGRFEYLTAGEGTPEGDVQALYADEAGRLWIGTIGGGVGRIDDPAAVRIGVQRYTTVEGLSSNTVRAFTEDRWGRVYVGTARGVNRLDPRTGHVRVYTAADGLPGNEVHAAYRDREDRLWFGTSNAVATLVPEAGQPARAPSVWISGVQVAGRPRSISEFGQVDVSRIELGANENRLRIAFFALAFGPAGSVRYRYRLEGADETWSQPSGERAVNYERLAPGRYRFVVAASTDGVAGGPTASIAFQILPPVWQRWWFISIATVLMGMAFVAVHRIRLRRLVELERIRGRIATDLHDDIGSGLSQIAILSEVAIRQVGGNEPAREPLSRIAATSRELVDTMSDIVWALNPRCEHLGDLTQRMRRFASDVLGSRDIDFRLQVPTAADHTKLGAHLRREVYLIFKESVTNIVRHSGCSEAEIEFHLDRRQMILRVRDNGPGVPSEHSGNGLANMRARATRLGGSLVVRSQTGRGTTLTLTLPLTSPLG
jgi:ligand-binding sensor domain-containing protein